jgi:isopropylmalate/homocitrate/citramalate synthase
VDRVIIFDSTLRDGEQSAGAALNIDEKVQIARQLERLRVDVIEAGFPISSPGDMEAVRRISQEVREPTICALAHANKDAVDAAWQAIKDAQHPRIHVFLLFLPAFVAAFGVVLHGIVRLRIYGYLPSFKPCSTKNRYVSYLTRLDTL